MVFNSFEFLIFLPLAFIIYWKGARTPVQRNLFIVIASYLFYGWWDYRFLLLLAFTTACGFFSGILLERHEDNRPLRRFILWANVIVNLGILAIFKYLNFFVDSLAHLLAPMGITLDSVTLDLILPVGISFYTFQTLGYTIDVYRNKIQATRNALAFFAFISFFPQLVAGPIERAANLLPQFLTIRRFNYQSAVAGMRRILWGLFKKVVIADNCAVLANGIFSEYETAGAVNLWFGALYFTFQIYGDFSGYSDIAIGTARLFGINMTENFSLPYFSRDIAEFWRRWHISLTSWFRDYVYIPLGGSRVKKSKIVRNTFIVFLTSGLWHGANTVFIAWGFYHAVLFLPSIITGRRRRIREPATVLKETALMGFTFILVMIGWVIFRAGNMETALNYIRLMFTDFTPHAAMWGKICLSGIIFLVGAEWLTRRRECPLDFDDTGIFRYRFARWTVYYILFMLVMVMEPSSQQFIYFQF